jgi:hypothetical protein
MFPQALEWFAYWERQPSGTLVFKDWVLTSRGTGMALDMALSLVAGGSHAQLTDPTTGHRLTAALAPGLPGFPTV